MKTLYLADRCEWRAWLEKNAKTSEGVWLLYYKRNSGRPRIAYNDAVEEALCFGWIDSKIKKVDEVSFAQWFTPRKPKSQWAPSNIKRVKNLMKLGKMTRAGLDAFESHLSRKTLALPTQLPRDLLGKFKKEASAWTNFGQFPPSYRRMAIAWVASAKKEETQVKRLSQLIDFSAANKRIKFM
jgi:uncharacterized protein YdeI (YjbR/CyaY-like superfamily)